MDRLTIVYDEPQEADWFRALHPELANADEAAMSDVRRRPEIAHVLAYDRPDVILVETASYRPLLVVEETIEVPSGHNVGQRFARLAAAAECGVPALYFGPYVARKHGGITAGPRYMNLRLFAALDAMVRATGTAVTTINWPVDDRCEIRRDLDKDRDVREYMRTFMGLRHLRDPQELSAGLLGSDVHIRMVREREAFARTIKKRGQYEKPPASVMILGRREFGRMYGLEPLPEIDESVVYRVGMTSIRSDPYTGMAILYRYLYLAEHPGRALILWFPEISFAAWNRAKAGSSRKDIRLFSHAADAILFSDRFVLNRDL